MIFTNILRLTENYEFTPKLKKFFFKPKYNGTKIFKDFHDQIYFIAPISHISGINFAVSKFNRIKPYKL